MTGVAIGVNLKAASTTMTHGLGDRQIDHEGNEWVYVESGATIVAGDVVAADEDYKAVLLTKALADAGSKVAVAAYAIANNSFGWVQTRGVFPSLNVATSTATGKALYTTATAGRLSHTSSNQTRVEALVTTAAEAANRAPGMSGVTLHAIAIDN